MFKEILEFKSYLKYNKIVNIAKIYHSLYNLTFFKLYCQFISQYYKLIK